MFADHMYIK
jgi:hypothetical protein